MLQLPEKERSMYIIKAPLTVVNNKNNLESFLFVQWYQEPTTNANAVEDIDARLERNENRLLKAITSFGQFITYPYSLVM